MKYYLISLFFLPLSLQAQHYYNDIAGTLELNKLFTLYRQAGVSTITAGGFNEQNLPVTDFSEQQIIAATENRITITRRVNGVPTFETFVFDTDNRVTRFTDSSSSTVSNTDYFYDREGRITGLVNTIRDTVADIFEKEEHAWLYSPSGRAEKMLLIRNDKDSTEFRFKADEQGNIIEETMYRNNLPGEAVYYYYNDSGKLTDIVRYNTKARRLLPDFMFEYNTDGFLSQKISTLSNPKIGYIIWRYQYNEKGLKTREANFTKEKKLIGRIDYKYTY